MDAVPQTSTILITGGTHLSANTAHIHGGQDERARAAQRLSESVADGAQYDTQIQEDAGYCHPETRKRLIREYIHWTTAPARNPGYSSTSVRRTTLTSTNATHTRLHWFSGPAGAGKSAIMRSLAQELDKRKVLVGNYFFSQSDVRRNNAQRLWTTLAYQLWFRVRSARPFVEDAICDDPRLLLMETSLRRQMQQLFVEPLRTAFSTRAGESPLPYVIIIDGLDECDIAGQYLILDLLPILLAELPNLVIFIASRAERHIANVFESDDFASRITKSTLRASKQDVATYLLLELKRIQKRDPELRAFIEWPSIENLALLVELSSGYFIYPTTIVRFLDPRGNLRGLGRQERLQIILNSSSNGAGPIKENPFAGLDALYIAILDACAPSDPIEFERFKRALALVCLPAIPMWPFPVRIDHESREDILSFVFDLDIKGLRLMFEELASLVSFQQRGGRSLLPRAHHASLVNFLSDPKRSGRYFVAARPEDHHIVLLRRYISAKRLPSAFPTLFHQVLVLHHFTTTPSTQLLIARQLIPDFQDSASLSLNQFPLLLDGLAPIDQRLVVCFIMDHIAHILEDSTGFEPTATLSEELQVWVQRSVRHVLSTAVESEDKTRADETKCLLTAAIRSTVSMRGRTANTNTTATAIQTEWESWRDIIPRFVEVRRFRFWARWLMMDPGRAITVASVVAGVDSGPLLDSSAVTDNQRAFAARALVYLISCVRLELRGRPFVDDLAKTVAVVLPSAAEGDEELVECLCALRDTVTCEENLIDVDVLEECVMRIDEYIEKCARGKRDFGRMMSDSVPCSTTVSQEIEAVGQVYPAEIPSVDDDLTIEPNLSKRGTSASPGTTLVSITPVFDQVEVDDVLPSAVEISEHKSTERSSALTSGGGWIVDSSWTTQEAWEAAYWVDNRSVEEVAVVLDNVRVT